MQVGLLHETFPHLKKHYPSQILCRVGRAFLFYKQLILTLANADREILIGMCVKGLPFLGEGGTEVGPIIRDKAWSADFITLPQFLLLCMPACAN